jgi:predicted transposase/invertase (TIGR01784 family)
MEESELAHFTPEQIRSYEDSLKYHRDLKNSLDTARQEAKEEKTIEIARELLKNGVSIDVISISTGLNQEQIERLK